MSSAPDLTSRLLRHERALIGSAIFLMALLCWAYLAAGAGLGAMGSTHMGSPPFAATVLMWWLMMGAMMLPSAVPAVLLYAQVRQSNARTGAALPAPWTFLAGYAAVWLLFSTGAALVQSGFAGPGMRIASPKLAGALLLAAGLYQLSPFKGACLAHCRSPAEFFTRHWRPGAAGAFRLGILHGAYCVGCCWMLMALLFIGGVMNLALVALLTAVVAAEKLLPGGRRIARLGGIALICGGLVAAAI
ncbi:MAG TPA: DUF2182 domain-containing protein [Sphingomicrobium sp.]|nr:DUF2182 domain-containing protein [Sphingomicrobium sp.]